MKKLLSIIVMGCAAITGSAQQINGDFTNWENCTPWDSKNNNTVFGTEPQGWCVSNVPNSMMPLVAEKYDNKGNTALLIKNASTGAPLNQTAPGYITLGTTWATAETNFNNTRNKDGGTWGGIKFTYRPDGLRFNYIYNEDNGDSQATVLAYMWTGDWTQKSVPANTAVGIFGWGTATPIDMTNRERNVLGISTDLGGAVTKSADAKLLFSHRNSILDANTDWKKYEIFFNWGENESADLNNAKLNIIISANDYFSQNIVGNNYIIIDDVELIYNSSLSDLQYNGKTITNFRKDSYSYEVKEAYTEGCLTAIKDCVGGSTNIAYNEKTGIATITVKGDDWSETNLNQHIYKVQFAIPVVTDYTNDLTVAINNTCTEPQRTTIQLIKEIDGSYSFALNRFTMTLGGATMPIGDIKLTNLNVNGNSYQKEQVIKITASDNGYWLGPQLGDIPVNLNAEVNNGELIADINIDMTATLGQIIKVIIAPTTTINDGASFNLENGLNNIALKRNFPAGWNTICLPFAASASSFTWSTPDGYDSYYVKIQKFSSADANGLTFTELQEGEMMEANKPYLIYFPAEKTIPTYFGVNVTSTTPVAVSKGDWSFIGTYTGLKAGEMTGKYGVMTNEQGTQSIRKAGAGASIKGTRAYFEYNGTANINSIKLNLEGETTGIDCIENGQLTISQFPANIYSLDGRLVKANANDLKGLSKGIYVVNGKKIIVK